MLHPTKLHFGPAGIPPSIFHPHTGGVVSGVNYIRDIHLDGMELEFVRQVYLTEKSAEQVKKAAKDDLLLTAHGSYYVNLNSKEKEKVHASKDRILKAARMLWLAGGYSLTFHAAYYLKDEKTAVYDTVKKQLKEIVDKLKQENNKIWIRPETTGKPSQFGELKEILKLSQELEQVMPCVDFSHLHARSNGKFNSALEFREVLNLIEKELGKQGLNNMHIHISGINYGEKGEKNHLNLKDSDMNWKELLKVLKEFNVKGMVACESPDIVGDALMLKKFYEKL